MKNDERFKALLNSYIDETISASESDELFSLIDSGEFDDMLQEHFQTNLLHVDAIKGAGLSPGKAQQIMANILTAEKSEEQPAAKVVRMAWARWAVAAAVTGIIGLTIFIWNKNESDAFQAFIPKETTETANNTDKVLHIKMEDGSSISLQPGSVIHYPAHFPADKREIYLEGEAFFQVSKNPDRPFLVYSSHTVTQVLGTSFTIKENKKTDEVEVVVRTGRVQVYENPKLLENGLAKSKGVIITPNQKVTYKERKRHFDATLVDNPVIITEDSATHTLDFIFERATLSSVLNDLENAYGIEITVENENVYNCTFTGDITKPDLYGKLDIIAQAVKASYEIEGTKILIRGQGCR